jgi:N6-adenosine-specific RNA methylase IME4
MSGARYRVILADPPWQWRAWNPATGGQRGPERHYPTMGTAAICALPVGGLAAPDSALLLWATWPMLPDALAVIRAWGFVYKSLAWIWVKLRRRGLGYHMGLGYYTRANSEPCLLATRGRVPVRAHDVLAVITAPVMAHSRKPDEQYAKAERLFAGPYCELFARRRRLGWAVWGNEVESDLALDASGAWGVV